MARFAASRMNSAVTVSPSPIHSGMTLGSVKRGRAILAMPLGRWAGYFLFGAGFAGILLGAMGLFGPRRRAHCA